MNKLTGNFKVVEVKNNTSRKGFEKLKEGDTFSILMDLKNHGRYRKHAVDIEIYIEGRVYYTTLNELSGIFERNFKIEQID